MKVAFVTDSILPYMRGGKEVRTHHITAQFDRQGIDYTVYTMASWGDGPAPNRTEGICKGSPTYRGSRRSIVSSLRFALACFKLLFRKFDVVEADHMPYLHLFSLWFVCLVTRRPLVVTWHEVWSLGYWREYLGPLGVIAYVLERIAERLPSQIICASEQSAELLRSRGIASKKIHVVRAGVDHHPQKRNSIRKSERISVLFIGRLIAHKRVDLVIEAVAMLRLRGITCDLTIVGNGPEYASLVKLAKSRDWKKHGETLFRSDVDDDEALNAQIETATVFASASEREGFGIAVAEALACGLPVVVSSHPDNYSKELIAGIPGCSEFASGSASELAAAIEQSHRRQIRPSAIRRRFMDLHPDLTWQSCAALIFYVLWRAVKGQRKRPDLIRTFTQSRVKQPQMLLGDAWARLTQRFATKTLPQWNIPRVSLPKISLPRFNASRTFFPRLSLSRFTSLTPPLLLAQLKPKVSRSTPSASSRLSPLAPPQSEFVREIEEPYRGRSWLWVVAISTAIVVYSKTYPTSPFGGENFVIQASIVAMIMLIPGLSIVNALGIRTETVVIRLCLAVGISVIEIMLVGAIASYVLPNLRIWRPLEYPWLALVLFIQILACSLLAKRAGRNPFDGLVPKDSRLRSIIQLGWLVVPLTACATEQQLNRTGDNVPVLAAAAGVVVLCVVLTVAARFWKLRLGIELPIFAIALAMLWFTSTRGFWVNGYDIQTELGIVNMTVQDGFWKVPGDGSAYGSMLSLTVLPAFINSVSGLDTLFLLKFVFPIFGALTATVIASKIARVSSNSIAVLLVSLLLFQNQTFFQELPALARQEISLFLFAVLIVVLSDRAMDRRHARISVIALAVGISVSHYTTSYLTAALILLAYFTNLLVRLIVRRRTSSLLRSPVATWYVTLIAVGSSWLWNGFITKSTSEVFKLLDFVNQHGLNLLPSGGQSSQNILETWLNGAATAPDFSPSEILSQSMSDRESIWTWMLLDEKARTWTPKILKDGTIPNLTDSSTALFVETVSGIFTQMILLMVVVLGAMFVSRAIFRRGDYERIAGHNIELVGWFVIAVISAGLLRLSGSLAAFYSPNRVAIQLVIVFAIPVALALNSLRPRLQGWWWGAGIAVYLVTASLHWNFQTLLFGGQLPPWATASSQPSAQQVPTLADISASRWMATNIGKKQLVSADVYSANFVTSQDGAVKFNLFPSSLPVMVDRRGYVFESTHNRVQGWGFDKFRGLTYCYRFPTEFYESTRLVYYVSDTTRVLR